MLFVFCHGVRQFVMFYFIITARKQSLRQGNIFTSVCHSFCPRREGVCIQGAVCLQGVCIQGGLPTAVLHPGGVCLQEVCIQRGVCIQVGWADPTPHPHQILRDMVNERAVHILLECILVK